MLRYVALVRSDISEERIASTIKATIGDTFLRNVCSYKATWR
jgi:hypothetical protein